MNIVERLNTEKFLQQRGHEISEDERKELETSRDGSMQMEIVKEER